MDEQTPTITDSQPPPNSFRLFGVVIDPSDVLLGTLAFFIPPLTVYFRKGFFTYEMLISVILTVLLGHLPGIVYALYIVHDTSVVLGNNARFNSSHNQYQQLPADIENQVESQDQEQGNNYSDSSLVSPIPQHPSRLNFRDETPSPTFANGGEGAQGSSSQQNTNKQPGVPPPSYDDVVGDTKARSEAGDHKVQLP